MPSHYFNPNSLRNLELNPNNPDTGSGFRFNPDLDPDRFGFNLYQPDADTPNTGSGFRFNPNSLNNLEVNPNYQNIDTPNTGSGFGFNSNTLNLASRGLSGLGNLARGYASIQNLKIAREALDFKKESHKRNFDLAMQNYRNQVTTTNNRITNQNTFKKAQGRTDLSKLVV